MNNGVNNMWVKEIRLHLDRLKCALFDGLDDERGLDAKNDAMRKAWGYAGVIETHLEMCGKKEKNKGGNDE